MLFLQVILLSIPLLLLYLYKKLHYLRKVQYCHWPQLPPSLLWGHSTGLYEFTKKGESERHIDVVLGEIKAHLGNPPVFLLDVRPIQSPLAVICSHEVAEQISKSTKAFPYSMAKSPTMAHLEPVLGKRSIVTAQAEQWKPLRKQFNPGFAPSHLLSLLPCILDRAWRFLEHLDGRANTGEEFTLDELCINLTFDIIGAVSMDVDLRAQYSKSEQSKIVSLFRELVISYTNPTRSSATAWGISGQLRKLQRRKLTRQIDTLLKEHIKHKFAESTLSSEETPKKKPRSILALSLQDITTLTPEIISQTADQLKSFLFAGHDTTSILLQWAFYELSRHPRALKAARDELDEIFGPDPSPSVVRDRLLSENGDSLLQRMTYISAIIKEILRLYPPSGSARLQHPGTGFNVTLPDGTSLCLDGLIVYNCATIIHRDEAVYGPTKDDFMPERWLGNTDTSMQTNNESGPDNKDAGSKIPASAWRPFERGPRNCIGQELANLEARVILACTVRRYDFTKVGLGEIVRDDNGEKVVDDMGRFMVKRPMFNKMQVTAKPVDGMRVKVNLAPGAKATLDCTQEAN